MLLVNEVRVHPHEKRSHVRVPVALPVVCEVLDGTRLHGTAKDISVGGMFVEAEASPPYGTSVTVVIRLPGASADLRLAGVVRWMKPEGFGIQFRLLGARETHAIASLMVKA